MKEQNLFIQVESTYFDGMSAKKRRVVLSLDSGMIRVSGDGVDFSCPAAEVRLSDGVGSVCRTIRFADGGVCEIVDTGMVAALEKLCDRSAHSGWIHRWEKSMLMVLAGLLCLALAIFAFMRFGVPPLAKRAAFALPQSVEARLGEDTLSALDKMIFKPSRLTQEKQAELSSVFRLVTKDPSCRIEFRYSPALGANALALPSGIIVVTDGLVELARNNDEIAAVLAHEVGHVKLRHGLRHVLQNSVTVLIMATLTGDLVSVTSLSATLPTALVDASFSREFEREADDAAIAWMKQHGVEPRSYAEILARLQAQANLRSGSQSYDGKFRNYLSTHPDTGERIRRIME